MMERKIMVEVTEEELKELNKEKTLDDYVDGLINCLDKKIVPDKIINNMSIATGQTISSKIWKTERYEITIFSDGVTNPQIKIELKEGNRKWN